MPTSRRRFLATLATVTLSLRARGGETAPVIVGEGAHRYRFHDAWPKLPAHLQWGVTHGVAVDRQGNVHVFHTSRPDAATKDCVVVFDRAGNFLRSWGSQFVGGAHGMDLIVEDGREILYLTDLQRGLFKMTLEGELLWHVAQPEWYRGRDAKYRPSNVAVGPEGDVFLADGYGSYFIHHLTKAGRYVRTFGGPGEEAGQTQHPHGLFIDRRGSEPLLVVGENDPKGEKPGRLQALSRRPAPAVFAHPGAFPAPFRPAGQAGGHPGSGRSRDAGGRAVPDGGELGRWLDDEGRGAGAADADERSLQARQVRLPARRGLRRGGEHLHRRVGGPRPHCEAGEAGGVSGVAE